MLKIKNFLLANGLILSVIATSAELAYSSTPMNNLMMPNLSQGTVLLEMPMQQLQTVSNMPSLDTSLFNTVSYVVDSNINAVASLYKNEYWGIQQPWKLSVTNLKNFVTASYYDLKMKNQIVNSLCGSLVSTVGKEQRWTTVKQHKELALGLMIDFLVYETLWQVQHNPALAVTLTLNLDKASEQKLYNVLYGNAYKRVCEQLLTNGMSNKEFVFNEDEFKQVMKETPAKYFRHDWNCYLNQFNVLRAGEVVNQNRKIRIGSALSKINTLINIKAQCVQRIKLLTQNAYGNAEKLISEFEKNSNFKKVVASVNRFTKTNVLKPDHNNLDYLIFLCNYCELQMSINNKKLDSVDTVINTWKKLITKVDKKLTQPPQRYLADLRLIMSMSVISALDYKITVNEKTIESILNIFNQIQHCGINTVNQVVDEFTGCHLAISLLKYNVDSQNFLDEIDQIRKTLPSIHFKTTCYLALLSCLSKNDNSFKTFGAAPEIYKALKRMTEDGPEAERIVIDCVNFWKKGKLSDFIRKFDKIKCVFPHENSLKKYYKEPIDKDVLSAFWLYVTTYGYTMGNPSKYFTTDKFINRNILLNLLKGIDFVNEPNEPQVTPLNKFNNTTSKVAPIKIETTKINNSNTKSVQVNPTKETTRNSETTKINLDKIGTSKIVSTKTVTTNQKNMLQADNKYNPKNLNSSKLVKLINSKNNSNNINGEVINIASNTVVENPNVSDSNINNKDIIANNNKINENKNNIKTRTTTKTTNINSIINKIKNKKNTK